MEKEALKNYIIIDIENNCIIGDYFEVIEKEEKEESIIISNWNSGYSISCKDKNDLKKEINNIISDYIKIEKNNN